MDAKTIISSLARTKTCFGRRESLQALETLILAIQGIISLPSPPSNIRGALRECLQILAKDDLFKKYSPQDIAYQPGQERVIYASLKKIYQEIVEAQNEEIRAATRRRKLSIDLNLGEGMKELAKGNATEADAYFMKAISFYKDEVSLFLLIGKALLVAKEVRRALPYLRKGHEAAPNDPKMKQLFDAATKQRQAL